MLQVNSSETVEGEILDLVTRIEISAASINNARKDLSILEAQRDALFQDLEKKIKALKGSLAHEIRIEIDREKRWSGQDRT